MRRAPLPDSLLPWHPWSYSADWPGAPRQVSNPYIMRIHYAITYVLSKLECFKLIAQPRRAWRPSGKFRSRYVTSEYMRLRLHMHFTLSMSFKKVSFFCSVTDLLLGWEVEVGFFMQCTSSRLAPLHTFELALKCPGEPKVCLSCAIAPFEF